MTAFPLENAHIRRHKVAGLETQPIRRTADGNIDTVYYLARGRVARSRAFYDVLARIGNALRRRRVNAKPRLAPCA